MIFTEKTACEKCSHKKICSVKELFEITKSKVDEISSCALDSFSITITCKEFREDVAVRSPFGK